MRQPEVVVSVVGDDLAASLAQPLVIGSALVSRVLGKPDPANARIAALRGHLRRIVRAAVADDEQLEIRERLPEHARDRMAKNAAPVVRRQDDSDLRLHPDSLPAAMRFGDGANSEGSGGRFTTAPQRTKSPSFFMCSGLTLPLW